MDTENKKSRSDILGVDPMTFVRDNIKNMEPYSCARDEFSGDADIFLDANESPYDNGVNRYPDSSQQQLKDIISVVKGCEGGLSTDQIFLGNGSDEVIDLLLRAFCEPAQDNIIICPPTYGMYSVSASINNVECRKVPLDEDFQPRVETILSVADSRSRILFLCSPNNPTGNIMDNQKVDRLLREFPGIVVMDEAYVDFAPGCSMVDKLDKYCNLVILQTLSKAWGMAGIRVGMCFASTEVVEVLNRIKPPYNVNSLSQQRAMETLNDKKQLTDHVQEICGERERVKKALEILPLVDKVWLSQANFLLVRVKNARELYLYLVKNGVIVRDRSTVKSLEQCLRISIGTKEQNDRMMELIASSCKL